MKCSDCVWLLPFQGCSELRKCKATGQVVPGLQIDVERSCPYYLPFKD